MEVVSIVEVIEKVEVTCHSAECIVVNSDPLCGFNNTEVNLTRCDTLDCPSCCTTEEDSSGDAACCAADLNETLRFSIDLVGAGAVAVYLLDDWIPVTARFGE